MDNSKLIKNLFGSMQDAIFLGDPLKEGRFACFMQPGEFVPIDIKENDASKDMYLQSSFCNKVIDTSIVNRFDKVGFAGNKELLGSIDEVYRNLLQRCSVPHKELTEEEENKLKKVRADISQWESAYTYHKGVCEKLEFTISVERNKQLPNPAIIADLRKKLNKAKKDWNVFGYRQEYDMAYSDLMAILRSTPRTYIQELTDRLDEHQRQDLDGNNYMQTFLSIPISSWNQIQWNNFETTVSEKDDYSYSKSTSWSGGMAGSWGLWSLGGGTSGSEEYAHNKSSATTISVKFDYITVRILRDWLRETLLHDRFWTWRKIWGGHLISDGGAISAEPPVRPVGSMPVLVNQLVIVRNVEISGDFSEAEMTHYRKELNAKASIGWGPFSVSGTYRSVTNEDHVTGSIGANTIKMNHPQIIAKSGVLLPLCPNPDRTLPFDPADAWFPGDTLSDGALELLNRARHIDYIVQQQASAEYAVRFSETAAAKEAASMANGEITRKISEIGDEFEIKLKGK